MPDRTPMLALGKMIVPAYLFPRKGEQAVIGTGTPPTSSSAPPKPDRAKHDCLTNQEIVVILETLPQALESRITFLHMLRVLQRSATRVQSISRQVRMASTMRAVGMDDAKG